MQDAAACDTGAAVNTAAFLVIEAMRVQERHPWDVWSPHTHKYFPAPARARAVELWPKGFLFSRAPHIARLGKEKEAFDLWMAFGMPQAVTRDDAPVVAHSKARAAPAPRVSDLFGNDVEWQLEPLEPVTLTEEDAVDGEELLALAGF